MQLPQPFIDKMKLLLGQEWEELLSSWDLPIRQGLRVNTLKVGVAEFLKRSPFALDPVPWTKDGFYYSAEERPAKSTYHQAGLYYLQEPSAMAPATCLGIEPGDRVLDLCAAPGGKSTQLAAIMQGQGLLVSNDNSEERVKALIWNLEHWGATNCVVTHETPERLARYFPAFFDKILVDAPCSGEGMFRKNERATKSWNNYNSITCGAMQKEILEQAALMLRPGGQILYSTCTFAPEENEEILVNFLKSHDDFTLSPLPFYPGWETGRSEWVEAGEVAHLLENTRRLWPHKIWGEGHFLALLHKNGERTLNIETPSHSSIDSPALTEFMIANLTKTLPGPFIQQGQHLYQVPVGIPDLKGLKVPRPGWYLGNLKNNRFEPSQALAMGLRSQDVQRAVSFAPFEILTTKYLKGETLLVEGQRGWTLVCVEEFPLGWAKQTGDNLKNYYPASWRLGNWG